MSECLIQKATLEAIGEAIRAKTGKTDQILVSELANEINTISTQAKNIFETDFTVSCTSSQEEQIDIYYIVSEDALVPQAVSEQKLAVCEIENFNAENIKKGVSILGREGSYDGFPIATNGLVELMPLTEITLTVAGSENIWMNAFFPNSFSTSVSLLDSPTSLTFLFFFENAIYYIICGDLKMEGTVSATLTNSGGNAEELGTPVEGMEIISFEVNNSKAPFFINVYEKTLSVFLNAAAYPEGTESVTKTIQIYQI